MIAAKAHRASREFDADERGSGVYQTRAVPALTPPLDAEARARVVAFLRERPATSLAVAANEIDIPIDFVDEPSEPSAPLVFRSLLWK